MRFFHPASGSIEKIPYNIIFNLREYFMELKLSGLLSTANRMHRNNLVSRGIR
jgi:hypothetical protein